MDKTVSWLILLSCKPTFSSTHSKRATPKLWTILELQGQSQILCILVETWDWQYVSNPTYRKRNRGCRRHQLVLLSAVETRWNHILNMFEPESSWNSLHAWRRILTPWWLYSQNVSFIYTPKRNPTRGICCHFFCRIFQWPIQAIPGPSTWPNSQLRLGMTAENHQQLWRWFARTNDQIRESLMGSMGSIRGPRIQWITRGSHGWPRKPPYGWCFFCEIALLTWTWFLIHRNLIWYTRVNW